MQRPTARRSLVRRLGTLAIVVASLAMGAPGVETAKAAAFVVTTTAAAGAGSLAAAVTSANGAAGSDTITFNIDADLDAGCDEGICTLVAPGGSVVITDAVTIDGYTQAGAVANTALSGTNAQIRIVVPFQVRIDSNGGGTTIKGLNIQAASPIVIQSNGNVIAGNFIGTNVTGTADYDATHTSINVNIMSANHNSIGGPALAARNLISGNGVGVRVLGESNVVSNNLIGTNAAGTAAIPNATGVGIHLGASATVVENNTISGNDVSGVLVENAAGTVVRGNRIGLHASSNTTAIPNGDSGVSITFTASNTTIGGLGVNDGNLIGGNTGNGIFVGIDSTGTVIKGNTIGVDPTPGLTAVPNGTGVFVSGEAVIGGADRGNLISGNTGDGILVSGLKAGASVTIRRNTIGGSSNGTLGAGNGDDGIQVANSSGVVIGGVGANERNIIRDNLRGVIITGNSSIGNEIRGNSITNNDSGGIVHFKAGFTFSENDPAPDSDTGPNNRVNFPELTTTTLDAGGLLSLAGQLQSEANNSFAIDFFRSPSCDTGTSNHGEGATYIGSIGAVTGATGIVPFATNFPGITQSALGQVITATATSIPSGTSEFSLCHTVVVPPVGDPCPGPASIAIEASKAIGEVWCAATGAIVEGDLPAGLSAIFNWDTPAQVFDFWFRGFPAGFQTLQQLETMGFYFFQGSAAGAIPNTGGNGLLAPAGTKSIGPTTAGANSDIWEGVDHAVGTLDTYASIAPATAIFSWDNPGQVFRFWFRGFPPAFQTLVDGLKRGKHHFFQVPGGQNIPED